ncbi:MAG TPA: nitroreductase/quinone reductase family protein [Candidatus Limnocylindria bacterium]|nr:nitroreductase/quinone reductase family protein [Candidatus Limnocylindria bacterium]
MTATATQRAKPAPRFLLRIFWALHRAIYRGTGGRIGLSQPREGKKFGMLRLTTVGRRSGQQRQVMVGFYPDGENLVTLAMNGWGEAEPAWWLNLQARPDATVELADGGRRPVRAREAIGSERDRLWERFDRFPGWGDVEALAAHRSRTTAVVVLEPR